MSCRPSWVPDYAKSDPGLLVVEPLDAEAEALGGAGSKPEPAPPPADPPPAPGRVGSLGAKAAPKKKAKKDKDWAPPPGPQVLS